MKTAKKIRYITNPQEHISAKIYNREKTEYGQIKGICHRWCAGCGSMSYKFIAVWDDGKRTYPCSAACEKYGRKDVHIL